MLAQTRHRKRNLQIDSFSAIALCGDGHGDSMRESGFVFCTGF